jgi:hypothetical protein
MKTHQLLCHAALCLLVPCVTLGQGSFYFNSSYLSVNAPVFDSGGQPLEGPGFLAELYGGNTAGALAPAVSLVSGVRVATPFLSGLSAGYFRGGSVYINDVPGYGWAWLQVRAWDAHLGSTYEEVAARGIGGYCESGLFYAQGGDASDILGLPGKLDGLQSFSLRAVVPEPSTWALLALGGLALGWASRRSRELS